MVLCEGDIILNKNPKGIKELSGSVVIRENDAGKKQYAIPLRIYCESYEEFLSWFDKKLKAPVLLDGKVRMNGKIVMTDDVDPNKSGDIIIRNNLPLFQPVLPMF